MPPRKKSKKPAPKKRLPLPRKIARLGALLSFAAVAILSTVGNWFVRHPNDWLESNRSPLTAPLEFFGKRSAFFTDALGWTGHDAVYESDDPVPSGSIAFAGLPRRTGAPAPADITVLNRGEFSIGWSPSLRHPVWAAYHVPKAPQFAAGKRPGFKKDRNVPASPVANAYSGSPYDRGHMVPNHAIATRFGPEAQAKTFLMSNIAPQFPALNRGPWRMLEKRIADFWTSRYGEIWVVAGAIDDAPKTSRETVSGSGVSVPGSFYMVVAAQDSDGVRALACLLPQTADRSAYLPYHIVTIDELEALTGLDFFPDMPSFLQRPLEADRPTRLWPIRWFDVFKLILAQFA